MSRPATITINELTDYQSGGWFLHLGETANVVEAPFRRVCKHAGYIGDHSSDVVVPSAQMHGVHMQFQHAIAQRYVSWFQRLSPTALCNFYYMPCQDSPESLAVEILSWGS